MEMMSSWSSVCDGVVTCFSCQTQRSITGHELLLRPEKKNTQKLVGPL